MGSNPRRAVNWQEFKSSSPKVCTSSSSFSEFDFSNFNSTKNRMRPYGTTVLNRMDRAKPHGHRAGWYRNVECSYGSIRLHTVPLRLHTVFSSTRFYRFKLMQAKSINFFEIDFKFEIKNFLLFEFDFGKKYRVQRLRAQVRVRSLYFE